MSDGMPDDTPENDNAPEDNARRDQDQRFDDMFDDLPSEDTVESLTAENIVLRQQVADLQQSVARTRLNNQKLRQQKETAQDETRRLIDAIEKETETGMQKTAAAFVTELAPVVTQLKEDIVAAIADGEDAHTEAMTQIADNLSAVFNRYAVTPDTETALQNETPPAASTNTPADPEKKPETPATVDALWLEKLALSQQIIELTNTMSKAQGDTLKLKAAVQQVVSDREDTLKRARREAEGESKKALDRPVKDIIEILDTVEIGLGHANDAGAEKVAAGYGRALSTIRDVFNRHGIAEIDPKSAKFDARKHEAVAKFPAPGVAPGTVTQVVQKGYEIEGRVVRYAKVLLAK